MRRKRPARQKLDTAKKIDPDWILNIKENIAAPSIILRSSLIMPGQAMRRSLLIHLHVSKWYQRQNKRFLVGSRSFQNLVFKASHRRLWRQTTYAATHFLQTLKYSERFLAEGKDPSKGYLLKSFHVPYSAPLLPAGLLPALILLAFIHLALNIQLFPTPSFPTSNFSYF